MKLNEVEGDFFLTGKGVRQGDPLSPILFNFVVDVFAKMLIKGTAQLIRGMCTRFVSRGVVCLQYTDDTLLFLDADPEVAFNMKWILTCFEQVSGMRINYHKSELVPINLEPEECEKYVQILQCVLGGFPIKFCS